MKKIVAIGLLLCALVVPSVSYAEHSQGDSAADDKKQCSMHKDKDCSKADCGDEQYACPIVAKFFKKAKFFLKNKTEIGLNEEQIKTIKGLKTEVKKTYIRQMAEMQIFELDLDSKLSEPKVDVEGINAMIDQGMLGMSQGTKSTVEAYAKLKGVLSDDQMSKAKAIWMKNE